MNGYTFKWSNFLLSGGQLVEERTFFFLPKDFAILGIKQEATEAVRFEQMAENMVPNTF